MKNIGIIGFGNMGGALAAGLVKEPGKYSIRISELKEERSSYARETFGIPNVVDKKELVRDSDIVVIAVKPQELENLFSEIREVAVDKQIISICAGKKISFFSNNLNTEHVARFMPNLGAMEGASVTGVAFSLHLSDEFKKECLSIASALGAAVELSESLMPAITGLSGSGIAFVFSFIHAMALGGTSAGINYAKSLEITLKTIEGALKVVEKNKVNPIEMLSRVISPAGTTISGVEALEKGGFSYSVMDAVKSAAHRAKELES